jgi:hypothetical protein
VVTTDASDTLAALDDRLDDDEDGKERHATPLIDADTGIVIEQPPQLAPTDDEKRAFLYTCHGVFLDELLLLLPPDTTITTTTTSTDDDDDETVANTKQSSSAAALWLKEFDIDHQTDEISKLLHDHPQTLGHTLSELMDQVEYPEFWKRYFYRLADERLDATYDEYYYKQQQQEVAAAEADSYKNKGAGAALTSMSNFFGGAVKRLVEESGDDDGDDGDDDENNKDSTTATSALNFFGGGGRPPFVLNTAVSEDDDDDEEEEELGWDDEDEDDDDDNENRNDDDNEDDDHDHQIEFKDAEKERMQEELAQAMAERDLLHTTVEMQTQELQKLKALGRNNRAASKRRSSL